MKNIPIIVLAGSLGCGKTTLLNHILGSSHSRIGVIINDFGAINIDALLIEGQVDSAQTITGGCLCCIADPSELDDALDSLTQPSLDLDAIIIESSGLAEPRDLARMVLSSQQPRATFGGIVVMVDCHAWLQAGQSADSLTNSDQFNVASLLVANKADALTTEQQETFRQQLKSVTPRTPVVFTTAGNLAPDLLFDNPNRPPASGQLSLVDLVRTHHHHHSHHDSFAWDSADGCDPNRVVQLLEDLPADVVRAKGIFWCPGACDHLHFIAHSVAGIITIESKPRPRGTKPSSQMVFIGAHLDHDALNHAMAACCTLEPVAEQTVENLSRFAPPPPDAPRGPLVTADDDIVQAALGQELTPAGQTSDSGTEPAGSNVVYDSDLNAGHSASSADHPWSTPDSDFHDAQPHDEPPVEVEDLPEGWDETDF